MLKLTKIITLEISTALRYKIATSFSYFINIRNEEI